MRDRLETYIDISSQKIKDAKFPATDIAETVQIHVEQYLNEFAEKLQWEPGDLLRIYIFNTNSEEK